jgi:hypothetical protein
MDPPFLTSALDGGECPHSLPGRFTPGKGGSNIHYIRDWVDPKAGLDAVQWSKICCPCLESEPRVQPLAIRYSE